MADTTRKSRLREIPLSEAKDDLSHLLREAAKAEIVITRHGKPASVLIGFETEDDWFEYRLEHDPRFLRASRVPGRTFVRAAAHGSRTSSAPAR